MSALKTEGIDPPAIPQSHQSTDFRAKHSQYPCCDGGHVVARYTAGREVGLKSQLYYESTGPNENTAYKIRKPCLPIYLMRELEDIFIDAASRLYSGTRQSTRKPGFLRRCA